MKIGDEVYIHGYVDEIRQNVVIIRNDGGYFGTVAEEITNKSQPRTGRWRKVSMDKYIQHATYYYECNECGDQHIGQANYCPNCGCKMEVEE